MYRFIENEIIHICAVSLLILLALIVVKFVIVPLSASNGAIAAQAAVYRDLVSDNNRYAAIKLQLLQKKTALENTRTRFALPVLQTGDLSSVLQLLISRAKESDIRFVKMAPEADLKGNPNNYPVLLEMNTSYHSLGRFVASLETLPHVFLIQRLAITSEKTDISVRMLVTCVLSQSKDKQ